MISISAQFPIGNTSFVISDDGNAITSSELATTLNLSLNDKDVYFTNDYVYIYLPEFGAYMVNSLSKTNTTYESIKGHIDGKPVMFVAHSIFEDNDNLTQIPSFANGFTWSECGRAHGECVFYNCDGLTNVVLPEEYAHLTFMMFASCKNLETITIPATVTGIGSAVFDNCTSLREIKFNGTKQQWNDGGFMQMFDHTDMTLLPVTHVTCSDGNIEIPK